MTRWPVRSTRLTRLIRLSTPPRLLSVDCWDCTRHLNSLLHSLLYLPATVMPGVINNIFSEFLVESLSPAFTVAIGPTAAAAAGDDDRLLLLVMCYADVVIAETSTWRHVQFLARGIIYCMLSALYAVARPSVCPSVRHTGGSVKNGWSSDAIFTIR